MVFPDQFWIGRTMIAVSAIGLIWLLLHHFGIQRQRMTAAIGIGMVVFGVAFLACAAWYFFPLQASKSEIQTGKESSIRKPTLPGDSDAIYQSRVIVGRAFGARRSPTDATSIEFVEITHATQFNRAVPFEYQDYILQFQSAYSLTMVDASRPQDGPIYSTVKAKIIGMQ